MDIHQKNQLNKLLIIWYSNGYRKLPWRTNPSLYKTVISEFMLQQTQVKTVLPYFEKWIKTFPDFHTLAKASDESILKHWEGLGYYSRARNLHKLAKVLSSLPSIPKTPEEWQKLSGVGPYTAAAICSIAFSFPIAVVDGNVIRILSRLFAYDKPLKNNADAVKIFTPLATKFLNTTDPNTHNQAMMELGATTCLKHSPLCTVCPFVTFCKAAGKGIQGSLPRLIRKKTTQLTLNRLWIQKDDCLLLEQIPTNAARLANLYELPSNANTQIPLTNITPTATLKRAISNQSIQENLYQIPLSPSIKTIMHKQPHWQWIPLSQIESIALSGPHRKWINRLLKQGLFTS